MSTTEESKIKLEAPGKDTGFRKQVGEGGGARGGWGW